VIRDANSWLHQITDRMDSSRGLKHRELSAAFPASSYCLKPSALSLVKETVRLAISRDFSGVRLTNGRRARGRVFPWIFAGAGPPGEMNLLRSFTSGINIRRCVVAFRARTALAASLAVSRTAGIFHCISARREKAEEPSNIRRCLGGIGPPEMSTRR